MSGLVNATATLNGLTIGVGTGYPIDEPGIGGLGVPPTKTADTTLDGSDGASAAPDFLDIRVITIPLIINGTDQDEAFTGLAALNAAWAPARDGVDLELAMTLPSWGSVIVTGRPRGVEIDVAEAGEGTILALCRFDCMDPTIYAAGS